MKQKIMVLGAATIFAALALAACDDANVSGPDRTPSSSSHTPSSSSVVSSSSTEPDGECVHVNHKCNDCEGPDCPVYAQPCNACDNFGMKAVECGSGEAYVCLGIWTEEREIYDENFYCGEIAPYPCMEDGETCGYRPCNPDGPRNKQDCFTGENYECESGYWLPVERCRSITDQGNQLAPHSCDVELEVAKDCAKGFYMMCANGYWLEAPDCDRSASRCGYDDNKLCNEFDLRDFCKDDRVDSANHDNGLLDQGNGADDSGLESCLHITDNEGVRTKMCSMTPCMPGTTAVDCANHADYVCDGGVWMRLSDTDSTATE